MMSLFVATLFVILTPGIVFTLPKRFSKIQVAIIHGLLFAAIYHVTHKAVWHYLYAEGFATASSPPLSFLTASSMVRASARSAQQYSANLDTAITRVGATATLAPLKYSDAIAEMKKSLKEIENIVSETQYSDAADQFIAALNKTTPLSYAEAIKGANEISTFLMGSKFNLNKPDTLGKLMAPLANVGGATYASAVEGLKAVATELKSGPVNNYITALTGPINSLTSRTPATYVEAVAAVKAATNAFRDTSINSEMSESVLMILRSKVGPAISADLQKAKDAAAAVGGKRCNYSSDCGGAPCNKVDGGDGSNGVGGICNWNWNLNQPN